MFWYTRQLVAGHHTSPAQEELRRLNGSGEIPGIYEFVNPMTDDVVDRLLEIADKHGPVTVKAHTALSDRIRRGIENDKIKVIFSYRDPRDMILSAIDHNERCVSSGRPRVFKEFTNVQNSIRPAVWWCKMTCEWVESGLPLLIKYDEIVRWPGQQIAKVAKLVDVEASPGTIASLLALEKKNRAVGKHEFNQARLVRYPTEMTLGEIQSCNHRLGKYIRQLGYHIDPSHLKPKKPFASRQLSRLKKFARRLPLVKSKKKPAA